MPTYVYRCKKCEYQFEKFQKMADEPIKVCPKCNGEVARIMFPVGVTFVGKGFHVNDYPSSNLTSSFAGSASSSSDSSKGSK